MGLLLILHGSKNGSAWELWHCLRTSGRLQVLQLLFPRVAVPTFGLLSAGTVTQKRLFIFLSVSAVVITSCEVRIAMCVSVHGRPSVT